MTFIDVREEKFPKYKVFTTNMKGGEIINIKESDTSLLSKTHRKFTIEQAIANDIGIHTEMLDDKEIIEYISSFQKKPNIFQKIIKFLLK